MAFIIKQIKGIRKNEWFFGVPGEGTTRSISNEYCIDGTRQEKGIDGAVLHRVLRHGARISFNEIDLVLFFCDPANPGGFDDINKIERLCDQYQIPFATNAATAEVLVQGLRRGDLDWRNIVNPQRR